MRPRVARAEVPHAVAWLSTVDGERSSRLGGFARRHNDADARRGEAGRRVRRVLLNGGTARIRDHAVVPKGTCKKKPQRDRRGRRAQGHLRSPNPLLSLHGMIAELAETPVSTGHQRVAGLPFAPS